MLKDQINVTVLNSFLYHSPACQKSDNMFHDRWQRYNDLIYKNVGLCTSCLIKQLSDSICLLLATT